MNQLQPQSVNAQSLKEKWIATIRDKEKPLMENVMYSSKNLESIPNAKPVLYLEEDNVLNLRLPGVERLRSSSNGATTRLDLYTKEAASFCGLDSECSCRSQYVVEILPSGEYTVRKMNGSEVSFNFHNPTGLFGIEVRSAAVSRGQDCSIRPPEPERTTVYWMQSGGTIKEPVVQVDGYVADAQIFSINGVNDESLIRLFL